MANIFSIVKAEDNSSMSCSSKQVSKTHSKLRWEGIVFSRMLFGIAQATKTGERRKQLQSWKGNKSRRFTCPTHKLLDHNRRLAVDG